MMLVRVRIGCRTQPKRTTAQPIGSDSTKAIATGSSASQMWSTRDWTTASWLIRRYSRTCSKKFTSRPRRPQPVELTLADVRRERALPHDPVGPAVGVHADGGAGRREEREVGDHAEAVPDVEAAFGRQEASAIAPAERSAGVVEREPQALHLGGDRLDGEVGRAGEGQTAVAAVPADEAGD